MNININDDALHEELVLPIDGLSNDAQDIINKVTEVYQCPRDFVTSAVFAAVSVAIGNKFRSFDGKYFNTPILWICDVARSGANKSQPTRWIFKPLRERDTENYRKYKKEVEEWRKIGCEGNAPKFKQLLISDSTPEARNKCLSENPDGIMLYRDELRAFFDDIGRYNKSGEVSQLLSIFDGDVTTINRKSEEPMLIEKPFLNIFGSIQPGVLYNSFANSLFMQNGFNPRWLFCYPDESDIPYYSEATIPDEYRKKWADFLNGILEIEYKDGSDVVPFSDEAKSLYKEFYNGMQIKKQSADDYMCAVYSKLQIQVERWALVAGMLRNYDMEVKPEIMEYSIRCMRYFERCAEKVYNNLQTDKPKINKADLIRKIHAEFGIKNQSAFAESIGVTQPYISKTLKNGSSYSVIGYTDAKASSIKEDIQDDIITAI